MRDFSFPFTLLSNYLIPNTQLIKDYDFTQKTYVGKISKYKITDENNIKNSQLTSENIEESNMTRYRGLV